MSNGQVELFDFINNGSIEVAVETNSKSNVKLTYEDFDFEKLNVYAGIDCIATSDLLSAIFPKIIEEEPIIDFDSKGKRLDLKAPPIIDSFHGLEIPAHEFILDLEINGMGYSVARNEFLSRKMTEELLELENKIWMGIGKKIDLNSGPAVAKFLYEEKGFVVPGLTKGGEPSTDGAAILTLAGLDPLGGKYVAKDPALQYLADMAKRRDISSVHNTFIKTYVQDWVKRDGRIHPSYNQFGTSSFRITGSDPNLTQLPRPRHGYNVRSCFTEDRGYVFISFDFSSAEVKVLANISREPAMLKAIAEGLDFHSFSASSMRGIPYEEMMAVLGDQSHSKYKEYKELRQLSKILTFSILYGSSVGGIAMQLYIEKSEAERLIGLYFRAFPKVKEYIENSHRFAKYNQLTMTPLGQRKRQYGTYPCFTKTASYNGSLRNSQNLIIQSTTSTIGLVTFAELNNRIKQFGASSTCTVFDSIEIKCPVDRAAEVINLAYETLDKYPMEAFDFLQLPIGCEGDVGISWGETKVVHPGVTQAEVLAILEKVKLESMASFGGILL